MIRIFWALTISLLLQCMAGAADRTLNLFIWSDYIDPGVVRTFEKKFSAKVNIDLYEDAESMVAKIQNGGMSLYDVIVPPDHTVPGLIKLGLVAPLRHERIPNLKNLDPEFANPVYDSGNKYTVPYQWGTLGIYARRLATGRLPQTWGLVFDPKLQSQSEPFVLIDSMRDLIGVALKYKGYSLNSTNLSELKEARQLLLDTKKRCAGFESSVAGRNRVLSKSVRSAIVYSGEGIRGLQEDGQTMYFIPQEGSQLWVDNLAVPAKAPHRDLAEDFINFILGAEVGAQVSKFAQCATPNRASMKYLPPETLNNPAIYPPEHVRKKLEVLTDLGAKTRVYDEIWTQLKAR